MITLLLEIKNRDSPVDFYNPAPCEFRAYPRTENGVKNAIGKFKKVISERPDIIDYRVAAYDGKKEYYNSNPFIGYIEKETIEENF